MPDPVPDRSDILKGPSRHRAIIGCDFAHIWRAQQAIMPAAANGDLVPHAAGLTDDNPKPWRGIMKALITALALVTLISAPSFAQRGDFGEHYNNSSPASPNYGSNGY